MSLKVLVIPEDPTYNGAILKPLVKRMLVECGKPRAWVQILTDPKVNGFDHACARMEAIAERYSHFDFLLFLPDNDGQDRSARLRNLEERAARRGGRLLCCAAIEEVETWLLAGHRLKLQQDWQQVREDVSVKENVFTPFLAQHGNRRELSGGRQRLMEETLKNYHSVTRLCPEVGKLEQRIKAVLEEIGA